MIGKEIIMLSGNETEKRKFHYYKNRFFKKDLDIDNILISNDIASGGKKYKDFIGYMDDDYKIKPFKMLSKTSKNIYGETEWMCYLIEDDKIFLKLQL